MRLRLACKMQILLAKGDLNQLQLRILMDTQVKKKDEHSKYQKVCAYAGACHRLHGCSCFIESVNRSGSRLGMGPGSQG
jgi:hypothetical protein